MVRTGSRPTRGAEERLSALETPQGRIVFVEPVDAALARSWLEGWTEWFGAGRVPIRDAQRKVHIAQIESRLGPLVAKRDRPHRVRTLLERWRLRVPRPARTFRWARALRAAGMRVPEPLAFIRTREGSCVVSRRIEGETPWRYLQGCAPAQRPARRAQILLAMAATIGALHGSGFRNSDLKAPNLLVSRKDRTRRNEDESDIEVFCVDLDSVARPKLGLSLNALTHDLSALCASFGTRNAQEIGMDGEHWREFLALYRDRTPTVAALRLVTLDELESRIARRMKERLSTAHGRELG